MSQRAILRNLLNIRAGFNEAAVCSPSAITAFLVPTVSASGGTVWSPPRPSIASRRPSLRGKGSVRGFLVDPTSNRQLVFESRLERGLAEMLRARQDVRQIVDQPPAVNYVDADGRTRSHTFDFLVVTADGRRHAIAVKPQAKVGRSGIEETLSLIRQQVGNRFADSYTLRTDQHITPDRVFNARLVLRSRLCRNDDDIAAIRMAIGNLPGTCKAADVVVHSHMGARAFNALVCLIDDGWLEPVGTGRIDYLTSVRRASAK